VTGRRQSRGDGGAATPNGDVKTSDPGPQVVYAQIPKARIAEDEHINSKSPEPFVIYSEIRAHPANDTS